MQPKQVDLTHRIFAYGTLKEGEPNHFHLHDNSHGRCRFIAHAQTEARFPLVIATRWNVPFLMHVPDKGHRIIGEVYAVDDDMLAWMDKFEGHPDIYHREKVRVVMSHQTFNIEDKNNRIQDSIDSCRISLKEKLLIEEDPDNDSPKKPHNGLSESATNCLNETNLKHLNNSTKPSAVKNAPLSRSDSVGSSKDTGAGLRIQKENKLPHRTVTESNPGTDSGSLQSMDCWCYFLSDYPEGLLDEPMRASYNGKADNFIDDEDLKGIVSIGEALQQYRRAPKQLVQSSPTTAILDS